MFRKLLPRLISSTLLKNESELQLQQIRTTFILKRRTPPGLHKIGGKPKPLRGRHYVYDFVKDTDVEKQPDIDLMLVSYVDGYGNPGDRISVNPTIAYNTLLLPGLAVYVTPENVQQCEQKTNETEVVHSSPFAQRTVEKLSRLLLSVVMNKEVPWTLEPWHIRTSFRKAGYHVAEDAIQLPNKAISGPDLSLENKEFYVTVIVNNLEKCNVRCRIHHWSTVPSERLPYQPEFWKDNTEPVFSEDVDVLTKLKTASSENITQKK